jgi:hypothetical protein
MPERHAHSCGTGGCSNAAPAGQAYCDACQKRRPPTSFRGGSGALDNPFGNSRRWKDQDKGVSVLVRRRNPICQYLDADGVQCNHASAVVHHLVDPKDDPRLFFSWHNLVAVCTAHHQGGQRGETQGYRYCHTIGFAAGVVYEHGALFPCWHENYVPQRGGDMVSFTTSTVGNAAILKALQEPI